MTSDGNLDQISKELGEAVKRIEKIQAAEKPPFAQRLTNHFRKHGNNLTSLVLAGCLFFVALGRLDLKSSHQVDLEKLKSLKAYSVRYLTLSLGTCRMRKSACSSS